MTDRLAPLGLAAIEGAQGDPVESLRRASQYSPYLARLQTRWPDVVERMTTAGPDAALEAAIADMRSAGAIANGLEEPMRVMRRAKEAAHLIVAGADLSGLWPLDKVVEHLTELADAAVQSALRLAIRAAWASGGLGETKDNDDLPGLFILAMGKMGARELNYSSDIDLIVLFDLDVLPVRGARVKEAMTRLTRDLV